MAMIYREFKPHPELVIYIDAYWTVTGDVLQPQTERIFPDGCVDIIFNLGDDFSAEADGFTMRNEKAYLVGTMTTFKETVVKKSTHLMGVRFKPAAFSVFYQHGSLFELTDKTILCDNMLSPEIGQIMKRSTDYLDQFFLRRVSRPKHDLFQVIDDIRQSRGQVKVEGLVRRHFTTSRQLERSFRQYVGTTPKAFINLVRFQHAMSVIRGNKSERSLLDIAFECGYYDHAHLTNEIKRYTGLNPGIL